MQKLSLVAAVAAALSVSSGAFAAEVTLDPNASMGNAGNANMGMMFLATTDDELAAIKAVGAATKVRVIPVSASGAEGAAFVKAATDMKDGLAKLQAALNANAAFKADLAAAKVDVTKVLVAEIAKDGLLTLYMQSGM